MVNSPDRRSFLAVLGGIVTAGCTDTTLKKALGTEERSFTSPGETGDDGGTSTDANAGSPPDAVELPGFELANVQPQPLETHVGISAVVYNSTAERATVTVKFTAYDSQGNQLHQGSDSVTVEAFDQAPISMYWEMDPDNALFQGWDAEIVSAA